MYLSFEIKKEIHMPKKKKQSRTKRILSVFNPRSPKGGMALFALLFAVVGGGFMLYRSFAATAIFRVRDNSGDIKVAYFNRADTNFAKCAFTGQAYSTPKYIDLESITVTQGDLNTTFSIDSWGDNSMLARQWGRISFYRSGIAKINPCWQGRNFYSLDYDINGCRLAWVRTTDADGNGVHNDLIYFGLGNETDGTCTTFYRNGVLNVRVKNSAINDWKAFKFWSYSYKDGKADPTPVGTFDASITAPSTTASSEADQEPNYDGKIKASSDPTVGTPGQ
jgi:hypothetical protein